MTIWVVTLEPVEQRYTGEWQAFLPHQIGDALAAAGSPEAVQVIGGPPVGGGTTPGAFLDFAATNIFKAAQLREFAEAFQQGAVKPGDRFLFTDAWHFGVIAVRYMSDLLRVPVKQIGLFHAGAYDPHDFLGRVPNPEWSKQFERSIYAALDLSCFATDFHVDLFRENLGIRTDGRILRCGWPMEYLRAVLRPYGSRPKRKLVLFPHRLAPEKQVGIFRDLAGEFPDYEFRVCQETALAKGEYHGLLGEAALAFSASLQETLGIGLYEGLLCGARPFAPARLSYSEMYPSEYLYPSAWTESSEAYRRHKRDLVAALGAALQAAHDPNEQLQLNEVARQVARRFFSGAKLYEALLR
ncbi:hypothetical protein [Aurantimonas sp. VKM B-3413]|uniref:hypothetical protein n=1 Tax=Aurantimonas sp. VKM B-3413 TaxID=2779401 RepID=UPI001E554A61|nr:hypothetical protein [Aurantimonas sp. VKM B-3413]MCB8837019.1 hypothetical protein [Aurantimonas sp. VKM B-3413]